MPDGAHRRGVLGAKGIVAVASLCREEPGRLTAHDPALVKAPHWVAYDDEACQKLEAAYAAFAKDPGVPDIVSNVGPARDVSVKTMKQINRKTGFERDVLRE